MDRPGRHFAWSEFEHASSARLTSSDRRGIRTLCALYLDPLRDEFGPCTVHSAKRSPERNAAVGGAPQSYHRYDLRPGHAAADVSFARGTARQWARSATRLGARWVGQYADHLHVDTR